MVNKMNVADSFVLATSTIVFILMALVTRKVFLIVEFGDKRLIFMLLFLDLTLICKFKFLIWKSALNYGRGITRKSWKIYPSFFNHILNK